MRIKKLLQFLDITAATPPRRQLRPTYRLTIVSLSSTLNTLRKQLYYELQGLDLRVSQVQVSRTDVEQLACTSVTLICPPHLRATLGAIAQRQRSGAHHRL